LYTKYFGCLRTGISHGDSSIDIDLERDINTARRRLVNDCPVVGTDT
jgi:hypothetical protein